jgi:hypothetical protein
VSLDEHAREDGLAIAFGGQCHVGLGADLEMDPGAALALEVDELDSAAAAPGAGLRRMPPGTRSRWTRPLAISFFHAPSRSLSSDAERVQAIGGVSAIGIPNAETTCVPAALGDLQDGMSPNEENGAHVRAG